MIDRGATIHLPREEQLFHHTPLIPVEIGVREIANGTAADGQPCSRRSSRRVVGSGLRVTAEKPLHGQHRFDIMAARQTCGCGCGAESMPSATLPDRPARRLGPCRGGSSGLKERRNRIAAQHSDQSVTYACTVHAWCSRAETRLSRTLNVPACYSASRRENFQKSTELHLVKFYLYRYIAYIYIYIYIYICYRCVCICIYV